MRMTCRVVAILTADAFAETGKYRGINVAIHQNGSLNKRLYHSCLTAFDRHAVNGRFAPIKPHYLSGVSEN